MDTTTQPQPELPQITVQDLASIQSCIDVACQRGAFRANEMAAIGTLYDKLANFLQAITAAAADDASEPPAQAADTTPPEGTE